MTSLVFNPPVHPGEILRDFMDEHGLKPYSLAKDIRVPRSRIEDLVRGERGVTADTALRLARYFGTTAEYWQNLQATYERDAAVLDHGDEINEIQPLNAAE